jgi:YD repeat-containing protein
MGIFINRSFRLSYLAMVIIALPFPASAENVTYTYDNLNRLTRAQYPDGAVIEYTYDAAGNRLARNLTIQSVNPPPPPPPPANQTPVAHAGPDQTVNVGTEVVLDGHGSSDPDHGPAPLAYQWTQSDGPGVTLNGSATATPRFSPTVPGTYTFNLMVSDGAVSSSADSASVMVGDVPVVVLSPNGGETWKARTVQTIRWYASGALANIGKRVTVRFSRNGGKKWKVLKKTNATAGSLPWKPKAADRSTQARVQVCLAPAVRKAKPVCDVSDGSFVIQK